MNVSQLLQQEGASDAYMRHFGGGGSALQSVWHAGILKKRGAPSWPTQVFRLIGGNSLLPETFANRRGERVKLNCPVTAIRHSGTGVTVEFREAGSPRSIDAEYLVCSMSAVMLRQIPVTPAFDERKRWAIANVPYYSATRPIFLAHSRFWQEQNTSINMEFGQSSLQHVWSMQTKLAAGTD
jgi:monoamine oxidase